MVTLVTHQPKEIHYEVLWKTNCIKQPREAAAQFILQPQYTENPSDICGGVITNAV